MQIEYDKEADAKYITFKKGKVAKTEPIQDWLNFDLADDGSVIGIEILDASQHHIGISQIGNEFVGYFETRPILSKHTLESDIPKLELPEEMISYKAGAVN